MGLLPIGVLEHQQLGEERHVPSINRPDPPYLQVASHYRQLIQSGELNDGDPLPSARQLARDWDITVATSSKALSVLRSEGLVRGITGVGTVVQSQGTLHRSARDRAISIDRTGKIYPPGHYAQIRSAELVAEAPQRVADALGTDAGSAVVRRVRTTYDAAGSPLSTSTSWFDGALADQAPLLTSTERLRQGTPGYIAEVTGRTIEHTYVQMAAQAADEQAAAELGLAPGSPVLTSRNRFVDQHDQVIEYGESASLPDHWVFYEYSSVRSENS